MAWATRQFSNRQVNRAGDILISGDACAADQEWALTAVSNWRAIHSFPLNTFQNTLRRKARQIYERSLIAQRLKRLSSIQLKLHLHPNMKLSQMQDIGGCRAVVNPVSAVNKLVSLYKRSDLKHELVEEYDYIRNPKASGYRGIHLVYRYYSDRKDAYNGLRIEMQFRSRSQHIWATAVEVVGTFTKQALKSGRGEEQWLRFFCLMGTAIAFRERTRPVPATPTNRNELKKELRKLAHQLQVEERLQAYAAALEPPPPITARRPHYFLLNLDFDKRRIYYTGFDRRELQHATDRYLAAEREAAATGHSDVVLVSVDSVQALKRAYPNYFLDTSVFLARLRKELED